MAEHQRNYPDPVNPSDSGGSLWEPSTGAGRRPSEWGDGPLPRREPEAAHPHAEQWQLGGDEPEYSGYPDAEHSRQAPPHHAPEPPQVVDPELAALAGGDQRGPVREERRGPLPPTFDDPRTGAPVSAPPPPPPPPPPAAPAPPPPPAPPSHPGGPAPVSPPPQLQAPIDPPTQAYPSMPRGPERPTQPVARQPRSAPPSEVVEGVYRKKRPGLAAAVGVVSALAALPGLVLLIAGLAADGGVQASGVVSGVLLLIGVPLIGAGLYPLLGSGPRIGGRELSALLRPPYVYLLTGLALVIAAGLAA